MCFVPYGTKYSSSIRFFYPYEIPNEMRKNNHPGGASNLCRQANDTGRTLQERPCVLSRTGQNIPHPSGFSTYIKSLPGWGTVFEHIHSPSKCVGKLRKRVGFELMCVVIRCIRVTIWFKRSGELRNCVETKFKPVDILRMNPKLLLMCVALHRKCVVALRMCVNKYRIRVGTI